MIVIQPETDSPLFTIVTLCYNHAPFIADYIKGLLSQTYNHVQLIIHDDCSTDHSWDLLQQALPDLRAKFTEVILERSEPNIGMWQSFLKVVEPSRIKGKYLSVLESDDYYLPERIEQVVKYMEAHPELGVVHTSSFRYIQADGSTTEYIHNPHEYKLEGNIFEDLLALNYITQCSVAFRYAIFQSIDLHAISQRGYKMADYPILLAMARISSFGYLNKSLVVYRVHLGSASNPNSEKKRYEFANSVHQIQIDTAKEAQIAPQKIHNLESAYHYRFFGETFKLGLYDLSQASLKWLENNDAHKLKSPFNRLRVFMIRRPMLRNIFRAIFYNPYFNRLRAKVRHTLS